MHVPRNSLTPNFWKVLRSATDDEAISAIILMKNYNELILNPTQTLQRELQNVRNMDPDDWPSKLERDRQHINKAVLMFQVEVTPSKTYVTGPYLEQSCRILRNYWKYRDHFVRVRFSDEDATAPIPAREVQIANYVLETLRDGITLAGRTFTFLAWSSSQLRSHSCFFFTPIVDGKYVVHNIDIINKLGDFWDDSAAKHGARIGQCLTATVGGFVIPVTECEVIKDITRNNYVFSDGVGTASFDVMERARKRLNLKDVPSAIQIRYGGAKGVLSLDDRLRGLIIRLRPSMQKFDSKHRDLEITGHSTYRIGYTNRQMITLLQSLGTTNTALQKLEKAYTSKIDKLIAGVIDERTLNQITWGHSKAILQEVIGVFGTKDGYLRALLNCHASKALRLLKSKTRIPIPNSAYAMGILDEYGCLEEDEVYYKGKTESGEEIPIIGDVIVLRSPCLHPGDVRRLKAVHRYDLSHLDNVIVFSRKGQRPVPNMISGGDLDGDHYTIIANRSIFPKFTVEPMDYTPTQKSTANNGHSYPEDHHEFFVHHIANDDLGKIANTWLAQCEIQERGALSPIAIRLAHVHSTAVDFPKTGVAAILPKDCKTSSYPDYMRKTARKSFDAGSFIGQSHRRVTKKYDNPFETAYFKLKVDADLSSYPENEYWMEEAREQYEQYCTAMQGLLNLFGASFDFEIVSGILRGVSKRRRGKKMNRAEKMELAYEDLKARFLQRFKQGTTVHDDKLAKASAWYCAVYESVEKPLFASFAWILAKYLVQIKEKANSQRRSFKKHMYH